MGRKMNTHCPLVSIIVPIYGVEKYIQKCAVSIFSQSYSNLEIIFVNDCTKDKSIQKLNEILDNDYPHMKCKVKILNCSKNKGLAGARKEGLLVAHGEYVLQIDSDDYIAKDMVKSMVDMAVAENSDIVICDMACVRGKKINIVSVRPSLIPMVCMQQVLKGIVHASVCNKLIRLNLYRENDILPIDGLNMREDLSVMYRLLFFSHKISYVPSAFYFYVLREGSISSAKMTNVQQKNSCELIKEMDTFFYNQCIIDKNSIEALYYFKALIMSDIYLYGDSKSAEYSLFKGLSMKHFLYHPTLSLNNKIMGIIVLTHFDVGVQIYRKCFSFLRKLRNELSPFI